LAPGENAPFEKMDAGVDKLRAAYRAADRMRPALLGREPVVVSQPASAL
jgi:hypothetical protein